MDKKKVAVVLIIAGVVFLFIAAPAGFIMIIVAAVLLIKNKKPAPSPVPIQAAPVPSTPAPVQASKVEHHKVAGVSYRQDAIKSLGQYNEDYKLTKSELARFGFEGDRVYELEFNPGTVELIEEPENEHDPNAVKVVVDGVHIGYIKRGSCSRVKKQIREGMIENITAEIKGGKYKELSDGQLIKEEWDFSAVVSIYLKEGAI